MNESKVNGKTFWKWSINCIFFQAWEAEKASSPNSTYCTMGTISYFHFERDDKWASIVDYSIYNCSMSSSTQHCQRWHRMYATQSIVKETWTIMWDMTALPGLVKVMQEASGAPQTEQLSLIASGGASSLERAERGQEFDHSKSWREFIKRPYILSSQRAYLPHWVLIQMYYNSEARFFFLSIFPIYVQKPILVDNMEENVVSNFLEKKLRFEISAACPRTGTLPPTVTEFTQMLGENGIFLSQWEYYVDRVKKILGLNKDMFKKQMSTNHMYVNIKIT